MDHATLTGGFKMKLASNTSDSVNEKRRHIRIKKPITKAIAVSLLLVLV
jgi:hypothetical protein